MLRNYCRMQFERFLQIFKGEKGLVLSFDAGGRYMENINGDTGGLAHKNGGFKHDFKRKSLRYENNRLSSFVA